jgi:hypothetical protein
MLVHNGLNFETWISKYFYIWQLLRNYTFIIELPVEINQPMQHLTWNLKHLYPRILNDSIFFFLFSKCRFLIRSTLKCKFWNIFLYMTAIRKMYFHYWTFGWYWSFKCKTKQSSSKLMSTPLFVKWVADTQITNMKWLTFWQKRLVQFQTSNNLNF